MKSIDEHSRLDFKNHPNITNRVEQQGIARKTRYLHPWTTVDLLRRSVVTGTNQAAQAVSLVKKDILQIVRDTFRPSSIASPICNFLQLHNIQIRIVRRDTCDSKRHDTLLFEKFDGTPATPVELQHSENQSALPSNPINSAPLVSVVRIDYTGHFFVKLVIGLTDKQFLLALRCFWAGKPFQ